MTGVFVLVGTLVVATVVGLVARARNGRMTVAAVAEDPAAVDLAALGHDAGARATLLQFSSAFCAPCRATRTLLDGVADLVPGVQHIEVDVADGDAALDLVRRLDIRRTPTTLILDARGQEIRRASGVPRREQVLAALGEAVGTEPVREPVDSDEVSGRDGHVR